MDNKNSGPSTGRQVINISAHGNQSRLENINDLNNSATQRYMDQVFDSQISRASHDQSLEYSSRNVNEYILQEQNIRKTEPMMKSSTSVQFNTHKIQSHIQHQKSAQLQVIDENKQTLGVQSSGQKKKIQTLNSGSYSNLPNLNTMKHDLSDVVSQSMKLEESVKAFDRRPQRIPGLTDFLCEKHYKKFGTYNRTQKELHKYWKSHVSSVYAQLRESKNRSYKETENLLHGSKFGISFKGQTFKENLNIDSNKATNNNVSIVSGNLEEQYKMLYEMDVVYTLQKDLEDEEIQRKGNELRMQEERRRIIEKEIKEDEEKAIFKMVQQYYVDLANFKIRQLDDQNKVEDKQAAKNWHKIKTNQSINPIDSIDEVKNEPQKPILGNEELDKEKERINKKLEKEMEFLQRFFKFVRSENLTNDPIELFQMYKNEQNKSAKDITWGGNESEVLEIINGFFGPQKLIKRIQLYYSECNKNGKYKGISLFGFYQQVKKRDRLLVFIDWKEVKKRKKEISDYELVKQLRKIFDIDPDFKREYLEISVEEWILAYNDLNKEDELQKMSLISSKLDKKRKKQDEKIMEKVFGEEKYKRLKEELSHKTGKKRLNELAQHKDQQQRKKILIQLQKKFSHDIVLQRLIKEEVKEYRPFKYPEEYDKIDEEEEYKCKFRGKTGLEVKELGEGKELLNTFKRLDENDLYMLNNEIRQQRSEEYQFEKFVRDRVETYLEMMKKRSDKQEESLRQFMSSTYHQAKYRFSKLINKRYPHYGYGQKEDSETYKKSYPRSFKKYFFSLVKSYVKNKKGGFKRVRQAPPTFMLPGGKRCHVHDFGCPEDCPHVTLNKRVLLRTHQMKRKQKEPLPYRSRVWRRKDFKEALKKVYMLSSELENCTFEPEAGSMSKYIDTALQANPNLAREGFLSEPDPEAYFNKLGKNFETSHPEVYKAGVLKRSKLKYSQGKYEEAMNGLCEGFNIDSLKMHFNPQDMKKFFGELMKKKREERLKKEEQDRQKKGGVDFRNRIHKEAPESQKKKPQEDFENKKLIPILREAYDLIVTLEKRKADAEKQINKIEREQNKSKKLMKSFSHYKKSQTRMDMTGNEKILFKSIMCPLKDKCSKVMKPRWPSSNIKSVTQFGEECPFAHHPMELRFPESITTKLAASYQTIKSINQRMDEEKPRQVFRPTGGLFDCNGCSQKSGKHIGGPCNLCRYKEMADEESKKFNDKNRKNSLMRSIERRETKEFKENNKEMHSIMQALDLDNNYTKKFGLLKKACVLHFYGRFNDAFDELAKAVKIIQDQQEIEQQKQKVIEKRWRFKLGLDDGFELPVPIETIDPTKVDEKFLKKLDLSGAVSLATLKLYIEQVSPMKGEEFSKHAYLNKQIEDYYLLFESAIEDKQNTIKKMKKQVEKLDEEADMMEAFGSGGQNSPERSPDKGDNNEGTVKFKPKKTKMCPVLLEKKFCPLAKQPKCPHAHSEFELEKMAPGSKMCERILRQEKCHLFKERKCPYAHNPIELDLIPTETKMKNLNGVIVSQTVKLKNMKPLEAWKPAKSGDIEHTHLMDMTSKKRKRNGEDEDEDDEENEKKKGKLKKSIFDRENVFRKPFESNQ